MKIFEHINGNFGTSGEAILLLKPADIKFLFQHIEDCKSDDLKLIKASAKKLETKLYDLL